MMFGCQKSTCYRELFRNSFAEIYFLEKKIPVILFIAFFQLLNFDATLKKSLKGYI